MANSTREMQIQIDDVQKNIDALNQSKELVLSKHMFLSGGAGKKKKNDFDSKVGSPSASSNKEKIRDDKKNLVQILRDADPEAAKEEIDKFGKFVSDLLYFLNI